MGVEPGHSCWPAALQGCPRQLQNVNVLRGARLREQTTYSRTKSSEVTGFEK